MRGLDKLGLVDQNWLERSSPALLLRTLVVGERQLRRFRCVQIFLKQSESIEAALDME